MKNKILQKAIKFCDENNYRLTEPRQRVLEIISSTKKPIKAYEILKKLSEVLDNNPKPPTIYRAIDFWHSHNFIHRVESQNAYFPCVENHLHKGSQFMICDECGKVIEAHLCDLPENIKQSTKKNAFIPKAWNLEIKGLCGNCL